MDKNKEEIRKMRRKRKAIDRREKEEKEERKKRGKRRKGRERGVLEIRSKYQARTDEIGRRNQ